MHNYDMNPLNTLMTMSESQKDLDYTLLTVHTHLSSVNFWHNNFNFSKTTAEIQMKLQ